MEYLEQARKYVEDRFGDDVDAQTADVLDRWESVLTRLEQDPMLCARELDWVAKLRLLEGYRSRDGLGWGSSRLQLVDLQYSDVRPEKGLYARLVARGAMERLVERGRGALGRRRTPRRTPGRTSAASACAATRPRSRPPPGTRSSSTSAGSRWSGCPRWSRCAAPGRTSARCWTVRPRRTRSWRPSPEGESRAAVLTAD